ncbi:MAG: LysO family transporter, partial [Candidatus Bathyarchaeia archaeon]
MIKYVLPVLTIGILVGYLNNNFGAPSLNIVFSEYVFNFSLIALLFLMGMLFATDEKAVAKMRQAKLKILVFPLSVALGSIIGGLVGGIILRLDVFA